MNCKISHSAWKNNNVKQPVYIVNRLFLYLSTKLIVLKIYAPNCTRLKAVTVNPLDTESKN